MEIKPYNIERGQITSLAVDGRVIKTWPIPADDLDYVINAVSEHIAVASDYIELKMRYTASKNRITKIFKPVDIVDNAHETIIRLQKRIREATTYEG